MNIRLSLATIILGIATLLTGCASEPMPNLQDPAVHDFYSEMLSALNRQNGPALDALQVGANGDVAVEFEYGNDGVVSNVRLVTRPQDNRVDNAVLYAVKHAAFPAKPAPWIASTTLRQS